MLKKVAFTVALFTSLAANAQSQDQAMLVGDFNGMAGALQAASNAFDHMKAGTKAVLEQAAKDAAELRYWREYFAGLPKQ